MRGQSLEHRRGGEPVTDPIRDRDEPVRRQDALLRIRARLRGHVRDAVAGLDVAHARPDGLDDAGALASYAGRQHADRVKTRTVVDIEEIQTDGGLADQHLAASRGTGVELLPPKDVGTARGVKPDRVRHPAESNGRRSAVHRRSGGPQRGARLQCVRPESARGSRACSSGTRCRPYTSAIGPDVQMRRQSTFERSRPPAPLRPSSLTRRFRYSQLSSCCSAGAHLPPTQSSTWRAFVPRWSFSTAAAISSCMVGTGAHSAPVGRCYRVGRVLETQN
jgi:hypothetical protein